MDYNKMSISEGSKYPGFWWYMAVELVLIICAVLAILAEDFQTGFIIFALIELREINLKLKSPTVDREQRQGEY